MPSVIDSAGAAGNTMTRPAVDSEVWDADASKLARPSFGTAIANPAAINAAPTSFIVALLNFSLDANRPKRLLTLGKIMEAPPKSHLPSARKVTPQERASQLSVDFAIGAATL